MVVVEVTGETVGVVRAAAVVEDEEETLAEGCTDNGGAPTGLDMTER